jgi:hypothetical protein
MATINELVGLIERGWAPSHIRQELKLKPYRLEQMLNSRRLQKFLAAHGRLARVASQYKACVLAVSAEASNGRIVPLPGVTTTS